MNSSDTVKQALLQYPTLYDNRITVLVSIFTGGSGWYWDKKGELIYNQHSFGKKFNGKMQYSDVNELIKKYTDELKNYETLDKEHYKSIISLYEGYIIDAEFEKVRRKFVAKNIDKISSYSDVYLTDEYKVYVGNQLDHLSSISKILNVPTNVTKDWGNAAIEFAEWWIHRLSVSNQGFIYYAPQHPDARKNSGEVWIKNVDQCYDDEQKRDFAIVLQLREVIRKIKISLEIKIVDPHEILNDIMKTSDTFES